MGYLVLERSWVFPPSLRASRLPLLHRIKTRKIPQSFATLLVATLVRRTVAREKLCYRTSYINRIAQDYWVSTNNRMMAKGAVLAPKPSPKCEVPASDGTTLFVRARNSA